jgi:hypothetical protein
MLATRNSQQISVLFRWGFMVPACLDSGPGELLCQEPGNINL